MRIPLFSLRENPSKNRENLLPRLIGIALRYFLGHFSRFVANFIGRSNTLSARYAQGALHFGNGYVTPYDNCGSAPAEDVLVAVRPEEFVLAADGQQGIDATVVSSVFLGLNTTYFVELYDGTNAEIVEESSISSIIPNGTKVKLTLKQDKINVFTADGKTNLTKGVVNDVR